MVNLCWCIDRITLHLGSVPQSPNSCPSAEWCIRGSSQVQAIYNGASTSPETANVPSIDSSCFDSWDKTIWELWAKTSGQFSGLWEKFPWNQQRKWDWQGGGTPPGKCTKRREDMCVGVCARGKWRLGVEVGAEAGSLSAASVLRLSKMREYLLSLQQWNPIPCSPYLLGLFSVTPATFAFLLFIHYLWQCKWLITFKMAP